MTSETDAKSSGLKHPSVMRFDRVQAILEGDETLKELLGPKDQEIQKKTGEKHFYSRGVVLVTMTLHERGFDAHNVDRHIVLALGSQLLPAKLPVSKPAPKAAQPKPAKKPEPKKPKPPKAPKKPEAKVTPKPPVKPEPAAPPAPAPAPAPAPSATSGPEVVPAVSEVDSNAAVVFYIYGTALSMAISLAKTLEVGDRLPGAELRQAAANDMVEMLLPLRDKPVPLPKDLMPAVIANVKTSASPKG